MKKFCSSFFCARKKIIKSEKKKMLSLTKEELKAYLDAKVCYISRKRILKKLFESINY